MHCSLNFEPLEARRLLNRDYGDAPLPYPVSFDEGVGAASHVATGPQLGAARDIDLNGMPSPDASGDGADDDGVTFGTLQAGAAAATIAVNVMNAPAGAKIDAWIDFDGDGNWGGQHERIAFATPVVEGDNTIAFTIPTEAVSGTTFSRVRLSTAGGLGVAGDAPDGEVEDYAVTILPPRQSAAVFVRSPAVVDAGAENVAEIASADMDGDGDWDIVSVRSELDSAAGSGVFWHEQLSDGAFVTHSVDQTLVEPRNLELADIDGDGDADLLVATHDPGVLYWFDNDGTGQFMRDVIGSLGDVPRGINPVDLDRDGDIDVLTTSTHNGGVQFFRNDGSQGFADLNIEVDHAYSGQSDIADLDRNGLLDVFASSHFSPDRVGRHQYIGGGVFITNFINSGVHSIVDIRLADMDNDGDIDAIASDFGVEQFYLYENNGTAGFARHTFAGGTRTTSLAAADLDGDGDLDVLTSHIDTSFTQPGRLEWYENDGDLNFTQRVVDDGIAWPLMSQPVDLDNDGDLDIVVADPVTEEIIWYENAASVGVIVDRDAIVEETLSSARLTLFRSGGAGDELTVDFTVTGDAAYGDDYTLAGADSFDGSTGTVTFPPGVNVVTLVVTAVDDDDVEPLEALQLIVAIPAGYVVGGSATVTIESGDFLGDYGDAPASYATLFANDGARHLAVGPILGSARDEELEGVVSTAADGDGADEDGVTFGKLRAGDNSALITVDVTGAPAGAVLDAWIDFDADGSWNGAGECIATAMPVVEGANQLTIAIPAGAASGTTYGRFRLSTAGVATPRGEAADGEVEDYAVAILPPADGGVFLDRQSIDAAADLPAGLASADVDLDGDLDLVAALHVDDELVWYQNLPGDLWEKHVIDGSFNGVHAVVAADLDGDGDEDVAAAPVNVSGGQIFWYENDAGAGFIEHLVLPNVFGLRANALVVGDFNADGTVDLAAASEFSGDVRLFLNDGSENFQSVDIAIPIDGVQGLSAVDLDRDGDLDLVVASASDNSSSAMNDNLVAWLENNGAGEFTLLVIDDTQINARDIAAADFDGDGDLDVVATFDDRVRWYENDGAPGSPSFAVHEIHAKLANYRRLRTVDLDGDGDADVVVATTTQTPAWLENDGDGGFTYRELPLAGGSQGDILPGDLDGDGDLDLAFGTTTGDTVAWYEAVPSVSVAAVLHPPGTSPDHISETSGGAIHFTFTRQGDPANPLTVHFAVGGAALFEYDYAVAGADSFSVNSGTITFSAGESTATLKASPIDDALPELDEPVVITILDGADYLVSDAGEASSVIVSDEFGGDLGDAPAPYPTSLAAGGAGHQPIGPRLGPTRTIETDGQPSPMADADDGVTFAAMSVGQLDATVAIDVQNAPLGARVDAWIDFNSDGHWGGPGERILHSALVAPGVNTFQFAVPVNAAAGVHASRLRLSTAGNLGPAGVAGDGEVEDYLVTILPPAGGDAVFIDRGGLVPAGENTFEFTPVDFDRDGDLDLLTPTRNGFVWYKTTGSQLFVVHEVQGSLNNTPNYVVVADFNGDGILDVALVSQLDDRLIWFEHDGTGVFAERDVAMVDDPIAIVALDFDQDGDQDLISLSRFNGRINLHENTVSGHFIASQLASLQAAADALHAADVDGDGDMDLVVGRRSQTHDIVWLENTLAGFVEHAFPTGGFFDDFVHLEVVDLDSDGDLDFVTAGIRQPNQIETLVIWWEQAAAGQFTRHEILATQRLVRGLRAADLDADGDVEIVSFGSATSSFSNSIVVYDNDGAQNFTPRDAAFPGLGTGIALADVDQDGDLDLITAHIRSTSNIQWHENITATEGDFDNNGAVNGSDFLAWQRGYSVLYDKRDLAAWQVTFGQTINPPLAAFVTVDSGDDVDLHRSQHENDDAYYKDDLSAEQRPMSNGSLMFSPPFLSLQNLSTTENDQEEELLIQQLFNGAEMPREHFFAEYAPTRRDPYEDFEDIVSSRNSLPKRRTMTDIYLALDEER